MFRKSYRFPEIFGTMTIIAFLALLLGCGPQNSSGAGSTGTGAGTGTVTGTGATTGSVTLSLTKLSDNSSTTSVSIDSPAKLTATVSNANGSPIAGTVVAFSTTSDLVFNPASGTALTNGNGAASITVNAGNTTGATSIKADTTDASGTAISGTIGISVSSPNLSLSAMTITPATISAGGSSGVNITVNNGSGNPFSTSVPVSFTSVGAQAGKATITQQVYTVNGVASATYKDSNWGTVDTITATLSIAGTAFTQTGTITVNPASAGSISFVSATPTNIALKGTGGVGRSETSVVVFKVLDTNGNAIKKTVNFSLLANTTVGGLSLSTSSADSDPVSGLVQTIVNAGTESTPVRVTATINGITPPITTTSDVLVVSTGIPAQDSFSVAASTLNIEGWDYDGVTSNVTVRLADHFKNPVPDGTAVSFRTCGGSIPASCTTTSGACTVQFTSQAPRPANGRAVVLAYALGEESFTDLNANGIYDPGEPWTDMPEPWLDCDENGVWEPGEDFIDTNGDGLYSPGDGIYNGILRNPSIIGPTTIHDRGSLTIVLSGTNASITINNGNQINLAHCTNGVSFNNTSTSFNLTVIDLHGNVMPAGTTISFSSSNGTIISIPTSYTVPNTSTMTPPTYTVRMISDATQDPNSLICSNSKTWGDFAVTVTTPKGTSTYQSVQVND